MTDSVKEQLSACLDGELAAAELDLLSKRTARDAELGQSMARYALIGAALRTADPLPASRAFAAKVMAAVEAEQPLRRSRRISPAAKRWLRPVAGLAVAAGVAAVAVISVRPPASLETIAINQEPANAPTLAPAASVSVEPPSYVVPTHTGSPAFIPATHLTNYVVAHSEYSSPLSRGAVLSSVLSDDEPEDQALIDVPAQAEEAAQ
jgi:sigma-E factor negative regulatory protein RseA